MSIGTDQIRFCRTELHRSLHGPAWHGPSLLEAVADVTAEEAHARPLRGAHSIAELAGHCLSWIEEVTRRLGGGSPALPQRGDWPDATRHHSWSELIALLGDAGDALDHAVAKFAPARLPEMVGGPVHDAPLGTSVSYVAMLHGLAQHNAYHGGQISLIKHGLRRSTAPKHVDQT